ncbi:MAG: hypothetical protein J7497_02220 [Chitinophagaceae bacterium]|nr:hypothetical protein [Chitinophagaceae bacterium]
MIVLRRQEKGSPVARFIRERSRFVYDHAGRVDTIFKKISNGTEKVLVANTYDELGRLKTKQVGNNMETQTYDYNVRGWLLGANRNYLTGASSNKFGYDIGYDNPNSIVPPGGYIPSYNGDIGGITWRSAGDGKNRKFKYTYDAAHRMLKAEYNQFNPANNAFDIGEGLDFTTTMGDGADPASAYDANGNIMAMMQKGFKANTSTIIDKLTYAYLSGFQ